MKGNDGKVLGKIHDFPKAVWAIDEKWNSRARQIKILLNSMCKAETGAAPGDLGK